MSSCEESISEAHGAANLSYIFFGMVAMYLYNNLVFYNL